MKHAYQFAAICAGLLAAASAVWPATPDDCHLQRKHGQQSEAQACYKSLTLAGDPYLRAEGYWGLENYEQANNEFRLAVAQNDKSVLYRVRWGMLLHERFNNTDAEGLFKEALQRDPKNAQAYLGLALVSADGFDSKAIDWVSSALAIDPKLVEAHELMAKLALEDSQTDEAIRQADDAINLSPDALDAMAIHAAVEVLADRSPDAWFAKIHQVNPAYGEAYALVAHHLVLNYRYEDAVDYYRKAIEADPQLWSAHSQLGIDLMRLGQEDEPRKQLEMCYDNGYRNEETVNSLRLLDSYKNFVTFRDAQHDHQAPQERSRPSAPVLGSGAEARHGHLRQEVPNDSTRPGAGGSLSRPRGFCGAHHGDARTGRAGRHVWRGCGDGQSVRAQAGRL